MTILKAKVELEWAPEYHLVVMSYYMDSWHCRIMIFSQNMTQTIWCFCRRGCIVEVEEAMISFFYSSGVQHYVIKFVSDLRQWFSLGPPVSSTNKTDHHDITELLLKVALNTPYFYNTRFLQGISFYTTMIKRIWLLRFPGHVTSAVKPVNWNDVLFP